MNIRYRHRFFDQVGHQTMYAFIGNKHFFTISSHRQSYQNYEQSRQKFVTFLEHKCMYVLKNFRILQSLRRLFINLVGLTDMI
jgi:hypothetical protein